MIATTADHPAESWEESPEPAGANPLALLHSALRGRYWVCIVLGALLAPAFAFLGLRATSPAYTSTGSIFIRPTQPSLVFGDDIDRPATAFESYVAEQLSLVESERVLNRAARQLQDVDAWRRDLENRRRAASATTPGGAPEGDEATGQLAVELLAALTGPGGAPVAIDWPSGIDGDIQLRDAVVAQRPRGSSQILVSADGNEPTLAQHVVNSLLWAYQILVIDEARLEFERKLDAIRVLMEQFRNERERYLRQASADPELTLGVEGVSKQIADAFDRLSEVEITIAQLRDRIELIGNAPEGTRAIPGGLTPDPVLENLLARQRDLEFQLSALAATLAPEHPRVVRVTRQLDALNAEIDALVPAATPRDDDATDGTPAAPAPDPQLAELRRALDRFEARRAELGSQIRRLSETKLRIETLVRQAEEAQQRFLDADSRFQRLQAERQSVEIARVTIRLGDRPLVPSSDKSTQLAAMGFVAGGGMAVALPLLWGLLFGTIRHPEDLGRQPGLHVVGALPEISRPTDRESVAAAWDAMHMVRGLLESLHRAGRTYAITSAGPSDGKTTLTAMLASSFSAAHRGVVVVDGDMVGKGISYSFAYQETPGLIEVLNEGRDPDELLMHPEGFSFAVLPAGRGDVGAGVSVRTSRFPELIARLRDRFDIVLVDTGPVLGSIESSGLLVSVDEVILAARHGQRTGLIRQAVARLRSMGVHAPTVVFTRTRPEYAMMGNQSLASLRSHKGGPRSWLVGVPQPDGDEPPRPLPPGQDTPTRESGGRAAS